MMMNRFALRLFTALAAVSMVISISAAASVIVDAKEATTYTVSTSEELEVETNVATLEVTEDGVVNYMGYVC